MLYLYFYYEYRDFLKKGSNIFLIFLVLETAIIISFAVGKLNIYARPVSLCALLILLLVNRRSAIILNIAYSSFLYWLCSKRSWPVIIIKCAGENIPSLPRFYKRIKEKPIFKSQMRRSCPRPLHTPLLLLLLTY